jgi:hypothetical protein
MMKADAIRAAVGWRQWLAGWIRKVVLPPADGQRMGSEASRRLAEYRGVSELSSGQLTLPGVLAPWRLFRPSKSGE